MAASANVNEAAVAEVPARGTLPAEATVAVPGGAANADVAAMTVNSEARSEALMPTLIAFLNLFKSCTSVWLG